MHYKETIVKLHSRCKFHTAIKLCYWCWNLYCCFQSPIQCRKVRFVHNETTKVQPLLWRFGAGAT